MGLQSELIADRTKGWRLGLKNMLSRENAKWWESSRWWVQILVWGLIINGILGMLLFLMPVVADVFENVQESELANLPDGVSAFFSFAGFSLPIGVVILIQGSIFQEVELGTAEWILSKPISRTAFIISKLIAHVIGIMATMVIVQSGIAYGLISLSQGTFIPGLNFFKGVAVLALEVSFYIALTLMMEVFAKTRNLVLAVSLGSALGGAILVNLFPGLGLVTPFALPSYISMVALDLVPDGFPLWLPLMLTSVYTIVFTLIAIIKFNRKAI
ncbi:ABC transporter permease [bacterium]|nr:ABC transporter permease [bacterium]